MTEEQKQERLQMVMDLGWQAATQAERLIKQGCFKGWTYEQLQKRYRTITALAGGEPTLWCEGYRIDPAHLEYERQYGAETRALEYLMYQAKQVREGQS